MREYLVVAAPVGVLVLGYILEVKGAFLYFGYEIVKLLAVLLAIVFASRGIAFIGRQKRASGIAIVVLSVAVLTLGWSLERLETSPRKRFVSMRRR